MAAVEESQAGPRLGRRARRLVERFDRDGGFELRRSPWTMTLILALDAALAALALVPLFVGRPDFLPLTLGLMSLPIIAVVIWVVVMMNPLVRVRVDGSGIVVHKRERVRWEWIAAMDIWRGGSRVFSRYAVLRLHDHAPVGNIQHRTGARIEKLPLMLAPNAAVQIEALGEIHRRIRERAGGEIAR